MYIEGAMVYYTTMNHYTTRSTSMFPQVNIEQLPRIDLVTRIVMSAPKCPCCNRMLHHSATGSICINALCPTKHKK